MNHVRRDSVASAVYRAESLRFGAFLNPERVAEVA